MTSESTETSAEDRTSSWQQRCESEPGDVVALLTELQPASEEETSGAGAG